METKKNTNRMKKCPRFLRCSAPRCPLDEFIDERVFFKGDPTCKMEKKVRLKIGKDMATRGLTKTELAAERRAKLVGKEELLRRLS